jgi:geranylgeranyl pyrophosphate synthase
MLCGASDAETRLLAACGAYLGIHYQFQDDIADVVAGASQLGKPTGMDQGKVTAVDLFGVEGAKKRAAQFVEASLAAIDQFGSEADLLRQLVCNATWAAL